MAIVLKDRVKETTTTTGTSSFTLDGAVGGFQSFAAVGNGNITYYAAVDPATGAWEVGKGTYSTTGPTLTRDTIYESSAAGAKISFGTGPKDVFVTYPAERAIYEEPNGNTLIDGGPLTIVGAGVTTYTSFAAVLAEMYADVNSFAQVYAQNLNDGSDASTDIVAYNDLGDGNTNFIDMGISSSNYTSATYPIFTPGSGYLYNDGGELLVGSATDDVVLFAGGVDTTDEAVRIDKTTKAVTTVADVNVGGALDVTGAAVFGSTVLLDANPTTALQAATKQYVDNQVTAGLHIHEPVRVETTGNLTATYVQGGTTFNITDITSTTTVTTSASHGLSVNDQIWLTTTAGNGLSTNTAYFVFSVPAANQLTLSLTFDGTQITGLTNASGLTYATRANSGVGATLTNAGAQGALNIDSVSLDVADRVMVRLQTNGAENGVYVVTVKGNGSTNWVLTRSADANVVNPGDPDGLGTGDYFFTQEGNINAGDSHVLTTEPNTMIIGYTTLTYTQFSGSVDYTGGTNINITGQVISLTGTVAATNGGTGTSTVTTGDLLYGSGTNTWGKLAAGAAYKSLTMNAGGTNVEWNAVALNQSGAVSGTLGPTNGGTGIASYAQGEMIYANASNSLDIVTANTTTTKKFLGQTGTGTAGLAPTWQQPAASDITGLAPSATTDTTDAANITSGTLPSARLNGSYTGITGVGTLTAGTWNGNAIAAGYGGTGLTSYAVGDLVYADTTTSLAKLADVATGNALISGGVGAAPSWGKIGLATHVSGTLPVANGGTNGSAVPTAGAVAFGTGTAYNFNSAGTSGQLLTSAGAGTPTWTTPSSLSVGTATNVAGGAANQVLYQTGSGATSFTVAPTTAGQALTWNGSAFVWQTAGSATLQNDTSTNSTFYPTFATTTSGAFTDARVSSTKLTFNPNTGTLGATVLNASGNGVYTLGEVRATGWWNTPTGSSYSALGVEMGVSSGQGFVLCYNRDTAAYATMNISGSACNLQISGSTVNVSSGTLQQGGSQVLTASNYTSYAVATSTQSNWSTQGTISNVVGMLAWKNYGNSHVIFDASASTSPSGTSVNNTNPQNSWAGTYPTLMGWNGANTYGVRVDSARYAENLGGYAASTFVGQLGSTYYQANTWIQLNGSYGLYAPTVNGAHWYPNTTSSYGAWATIGSRNTWRGIHFEGGGSQPHIMFDGSSNGGIYFEGGGRWQSYYSYGNNCTGFSTSSTASGYSIYTASSIYSSGNVVAASDERKKENIEPIKDALSIVKNLVGVYYNMIEDEKKKRRVGFIAQKTEPHLPEVVYYQEENDQYGVSYGDVTAVLAEAIKQLDDKLEAAMAKLG